MSEIDKVLGVVLQAIEIERFGYELYSSMRSNVKDKNGQKLLSFLAKFEVGHMQQLEEEYDRQLAKLDDLAEEQPQEISLLAKEEIFLGDEKIPEIFREFDPVAATSFAIEVEERSVKFYEKNMAISEDDRTKELFKELTDFEREHIEILQSNLQSLQENKTWTAPPMRVI